MTHNRSYENNIKWGNQVNSDLQGNLYRGTIHRRSSERLNYYDLPRDYYGTQARKQSYPMRNYRRAERRPTEVGPATSSPPRQQSNNSPIFLEEEPEPSPSQPQVIPLGGAPPSTQYPLIPVQEAPAPAELSPVELIPAAPIEPLPAAPREPSPGPLPYVSSLPEIDGGRRALATSTPVNAFRYQPLYKPRPQPMFPPLVPVEQPRSSYRGVYESNRHQYSGVPVPGYNAVGSILRSIKIHGF